MATASPIPPLLPVTNALFPSSLICAECTPSATNFNQSSIHENNDSSPREYPFATQPAPSQMRQLKHTRSEPRPCRMELHRVVEPFHLQHSSVAKFPPRV